MPAMQYSANHLEFLDFILVTCKPYFCTEYGAVLHKSEVSRSHTGSIQVKNTRRTVARFAPLAKDGNFGFTDNSFGQPYD